MYTRRFLPDTHGGLVLIPKNLCLSKYGSIDILAYYRHCIHQVLHFWKTSKKKNIQFCFLHNFYTVPSPSLAELMGVN